MNIEQVVRQVTVRGQAPGMDQVARAYDQVASAADRGTKSLQDNTSEAARAAASIERLADTMQDSLREQQKYNDMMAQQTRATQAMVAANDNYANSTSHVGDAIRYATKLAIDHAAAYLATAGAVGVGLLMFGSLLAVLGPIILAYKLIKDAVGLAGEAWRLGGEELARFVEIGKKAAALDLSTSFFQRITRAAEDAKVPVADLTAMLTNLQKASTEKLGGSDLQLRLDQHAKAGNFAGNTGVGQYAAANTQEERFRAIVTLIDQAMQKGERLAALDLAGTAFGSATQAALLKNSDYLNQMLAAADKVAATKLVSDGDVGRAIELERRYDAAVKLLEQRWHPVQDLLTSLGIRMREAWVGIVESMAAAFDWVFKLVAKIGEIPQSFWSYVNKGATITANYNPILPINLAARGIAALTAPAAPTPELSNYEKGVALLRPGLQNQNEVQRKVNEAMVIANKVFGDTSRTLDDHAKKVLDVRDQYDRATDTIEKHTARLEADRKAVDLGVGAQAQLRAEAALTVAAQQAQLPMTAKLRAEIEALAKANGVSAQKLAEDNAASQANFELQTAGLTGVEAQIASVQFRLHGKEWRDWSDDAISNTLRVADAQKQLTAGVNSFFDTMVQGALRGDNATKTLLSGLSTLSSTLTSIGTKSLGNSLQSALKGGSFSLDPSALGLGVAGIGLGLLSSIIGRGDQEREKEQQEAMQAAQDAAQRVLTYQARTAAALADTSSLIGQLAQLDHAQHQEQFEEAQKGGRAMTDLLAAQQAERLALIQKSVKDSQAAYDALIEQSKSATQTAVKNLTDATSNLAAALTALGHGIDDLSGGTAAAVAKLQADFAQALLQKINSAAGKDYLSTLGALVAQQQQDLRDAATLGINTSLVNQAFFAQAQKVIDDTGLTGAAFDQILQVFPALIGNAHAFTGATQASVSALHDFIVKMEDFRKSLLVDDALSTLSPAQRYAEAQAQFRDTLAKANTGDAAAQGNLQNAITTYLNASKSYNASNTQYATDFSEVQAAISGSELAAQTQINYAAQQLQQLIDLNKNVINLASSIADPAASTTAAAGVNAAAAAAAAAIEAAKTWHYPVLNPYYSGPATTNGGWNTSDYTRYRNEHPEARYQFGGLVTNGIWNQDSLTAQIAGGEYMTRAPSVNPQTLPVLQHINATGTVPGNDNGALDRLARAFRDVSRNDTDRIIEVLRQVIDELEAAPAKNRDAVRQLAHQGKPRANG